MIALQNIHSRLQSSEARNILPRIIPQKWIFVSKFLTRSRLKTFLIAYVKNLIAERDHLITPQLPQGQSSTYMYTRAVAVTPFVMDRARRLQRWNNRSCTHIDGGIQTVILMLFFIIFPGILPLTEMSFIGNYISIKYRYLCKIGTQKSP